MKKFKIISGITLLSIAILVTSCNKPGKCLKPTGKIINETIALNDFSIIEVHSYFDITLIQDSAQYIKFTGGKNLLPFVEAKTENNTLKLYDNNKCRWTRNYTKEKIKAEIHFTSIDSFIAYRECDIKSSDTIRNPKVLLFKFPTSHLATLNIKINTKDFYLKVNPSSGDYYVSGKCEYNYIYSIGYSYIHTENLECNEALVYSFETGDIYVAPKHYLDARLFNYGNIIYCSSPETIKITKPDFAKGKLIKKQC